MNMDIRSLVREWIGESKRVGNRDWWCCPFHQESTPSFTLVPDGTHFHCFGCGQHGDAVDFLKGMEPNLSFRECVDKLNAGDLVAPSRRNPRVKPAPPPPRRGERWQVELGNLVSQAADRLRSEDGAKARTWLHERGLTLDAIVNAGLGLVDVDVRLSTGIERESGEEQEVWVPRGITIPWMNAQGEIELLNVRRATGAPKYIAVTGSRRGGLFPSAEVIKAGRPVVICEGELDAILLGATLAERVPVVTLGAASSDPANWALAKLISASSWLVAVDADEAGQRLADRWAARWPGRTTRIIPPGECKDWSDAWVAGHDLEEFWAPLLSPMEPVVVAEPVTVAEPVAVAEPPEEVKSDLITVLRILALLRAGADPRRAIENTDSEDLPPPDVLQVSLEAAEEWFREEGHGVQQGDEPLSESDPWKGGQWSADGRSWTAD